MSKGDSVSSGSLAVGIDTYDAFVELVREETLDRNVPDLLSICGTVKDAFDGSAAGPPMVDRRGGGGEIGRAHV